MRSRIAMASDRLPVGSAVPLRRSREMDVAPFKPAVSLAAGGKMMTGIELRDDQVRVSVYGLKRLADRVLASAFTAQVIAVVDALRVSDRNVNNGRALYDYAIADLRPGSAIAVLSKVPVSRKRGNDPINPFGSAMESVTKEDASFISSHQFFLPSVARIMKGVGHKFSHSDLEIPQFKPFRIDDFMARQVSRLSRKVANDGEPYFRGVAIGSFDGVIEAVDIRGITPLVKLTLAAGRKEIDCICRGWTAAELGEVLGKRVWVEGRAHYDGMSGLPTRIEIIDNKIIKQAPDFLRWKNRFKGLTTIDMDS